MTGIMRDDRSTGIMRDWPIAIGSIERFLQGDTAEIPKIPGKFIAEDMLDDILRPMLDDASVERVVEFLQKNTEGSLRRIFVPWAYNYLRDRIQCQRRTWSSSVFAASFLNDGVSKHGRAILASEEHKCESMDQIRDGTVLKIVAAYIAHRDRLLSVEEEAQVVAMLKEKYSRSLLTLKLALKPSQRHVSSMLIRSVSEFLPSWQSFFIVQPEGDEACSAATNDEMPDAGYLRQRLGSEASVSNSVPNLHDPTTVN